MRVKAARLVACAAVNAGVLAACSPAPAPAASPRPLATVSERSPQFASPDSGRYTIQYDAGPQCPEFFDITYSVRGGGALFQVGSVAHQPGRAGAATFTLLASQPGLPYVFFIGTHRADSSAGTPCPGWTMAIFPAGGT